MYIHVYSIYYIYYIYMHVMQYAYKKSILYSNICIYMLCIYIYIYGSIIYIYKDIAAYGSVWFLLLIES